MTTIDAQPSTHTGVNEVFEGLLGAMFPVDANRALDLAQQGCTSSEIADLIDSGARAVDAALEGLVPGGAVTIRAALRHRLRTWHREHENRTWLDAEATFGVPHTHILRLVRAPRTAEVAHTAPESAGYLDAVLAGLDCRDARAATSARAYAMGATLQDLGDRFGVTRERIRQILGRDTPFSSTDIAAVLRTLRAARHQEQEQAVQQWSIERPAAPIADAVTMLGLSEPQVLELLGRRRTRHVPAASKDRASTRRSDEDILADLRKYHEHTGRVTSAGFTDWARERGVPGHQTASIRFGTWNDALRAAGISCAIGAPRSSFTDEDLWAAVVALVRAPDGGTTARVAEDWLAERAAAPSFALIRQRLSLPWAEIVQRALAVVNRAESVDPIWASVVGAERDWHAVPERAEPMQHVLAAIAELGPTLTTQRYGDWARETGRPTVQTLQRHTGKKWSQLVAEAGGTPNRPRVKGRTVEECGEFIANFLAEKPDGGSSDYAAWAVKHEAPSLSTIADRFGSWSAALAASRS